MVLKIRRSADQFDVCFKKRQNVYGFLNKLFKITAKVIEKLFKSSTRCVRLASLILFDRSFCLHNSVIRRQSELLLRGATEI